MLPNMLHVVSCLHVSTSCRWHNDAWNPAARASFKGIKEVPLVWKLYILWFDRPSSLIPWTWAQNIKKALQKRHRFGSTFGTGSSSKSFFQGFLWTLSSAQGARALKYAFKIPVSLKYDSTNFFFPWAALCLLFVFQASTTMFQVDYSDVLDRVVALPVALTREPGSLRR